MVAKDFNQFVFQGNSVRQGICITRAKFCQVITHKLTVP
jgi:hypothetical protein